MRFRVWMIEKFWSPFLLRRVTSSVRKYHDDMNQLNVEIIGVSNMATSLKTNSNNWDDCLNQSWIPFPFWWLVIKKSFRSLLINSKIPLIFLTRKILIKCILHGKTKREECEKQLQVDSWTLQFKLSTGRTTLLATWFTHFWSQGLFYFLLIS